MFRVRNWWDEGNVRALGKIVKSFSEAPRQPRFVTLDPSVAHVFMSQIVPVFRRPCSIVDMKLIDALRGSKRHLEHGELECHKTRFGRSHEYQLDVQPCSRPIVLDQPTFKRRQPGLNLVERPRRCL